MAAAGQLAALAMAPPPEAPLRQRSRAGQLWDWANEALAEDWQFNVEFDRYGEWADFLAARCKCTQLAASLFAARRPGSRAPVPYLRS